MKAVVRFFILVTAGITAFAGYASALDHELSGHARTRFEWTKNVGGEDKTDNETFLNRVRLNMDVMPSKSLTVRLAPQAIQGWGVNATTSGGAALQAYEAYMHWMINDMWALKAGRQELVFGDEVVFGNRDWTQGGLTHDAAQLILTHGMGTSSFFWAKSVENGQGADANAAAGTADNHDGDDDIFALYNTFNMTNVNALDVIDVYLWWNNGRQVADRDADTLNASTSRYMGAGLRLAGATGMVDYSLEGTGEFGYDNDTTGSSDMFKGISLDANIGASLMDRHHIALDVVYANSEYQNPNGELHNTLGDTDLLVRNNILSFGLETKWVLSDVFHAMLDGYYILKPKSGFGSAGGVTTTGSDRPLGFEGDIVLAYMPNDNLGFDLGYAFLKPMGGLDDVGLKVIHDLYVQGTLSF